MWLLVPFVVIQKQFQKLVLVYLWLTRIRLNWADFYQPCKEGKPKIGNQHKTKVTYNKQSFSHSSHPHIWT